MATFLGKARPHAVSVAPGNTWRAELQSYTKPRVNPKSAQFVSQDIFTTGGLLVKVSFVQHVMGSTDFRMG
jgi:hypothetical protein